MHVEIALWAAIAPFILLLLSNVWVYPAVLEDIVKWGLIRWGGRATGTAGAGTIVGLVFGVSEALLFLLNAWTGGQWGTVVTRFALTVPMHTLTGFVLGIFIQQRLGYLGLVIAMIIHAMFNYWVQ